MENKAGIKPRKLTDWLPTNKREVELRGWNYLDVILFSGDAYVDHPAFGAAVIGRILEAEGLHVAIVPQPDWRGDYRDFKKLGVPRFFFGVAPGAMDSMVNHYTANKRLRSDDAYSPDKQPRLRPDYPSIVYTEILKKLFPKTPVIVGGIEASLRRLAHYDYWQNRLRPSILADTPADLLVYGMGEKPIRAIVRQLREGIPFHQLHGIPQTAYISNRLEMVSGDIELFPFDECLKDKRKQAMNFKIIEEESNKYNSSRIIQRTKGRLIVVNPPYPPMNEEEIDASFDLPYTRMPHPKYDGKVIPAYEMIKFSVNIHRGCFGGCSFCTISAHQGKFIASRSFRSIRKEIESICAMPDFKGYISDLGGPSANMYQMRGKNKNICLKCKKTSCIAPTVCNNLCADHAPLLDLYNAVNQIPEIKKVFIGSGIRYDLLLHDYAEEAWNKSAKAYTETLITNHVSGRLKVAPEHTEESVLQLMRKPSFRLFEQFNRIFDRINSDKKCNQQLIPYFIASHPGCTEINMAELAVKMKKMKFRLEQVQDFTPTPMTLSTEMYYTGLHPYTLRPTSSAKTQEERRAQRIFFFGYMPEARSEILKILRKIKRTDLIAYLLGAAKKR